MNDTPQAIIFFDGICGLCNRFVDFTMARDTKKKFRYATLQGETFQQVLKLHPELAKLDSIIVTTPDFSTALSKSQGVFFALRKMDNPWKFLAAIGSVLPSFASNFFYDLVARNRYRVFGKKESCRLPTPEERELFYP